MTLGAFAVAAPALALRPQLLGMACFAILLVLVSDRRRHPAGLWAIPILVLVWANLHGSFFLAPVVLGLAWLEDVAEHWAGAHRTLLIALVSVATACVTPFGPAVWGYAVGLSTNPEVANRITEWQPTTIRDGTGVLFFLSLAAVVTLMARSGRAVPWTTLAWIGVFAAIGLYAQRGLAWWVTGGCSRGHRPAATGRRRARAGDVADLAASQRRRGGGAGAGRDRPAADVAPDRRRDGRSRGRPDGRAAGRDGCPPNGGATG